MVLKPITEFLRLEASSGILLLIAAILAVLAENSTANGLYDTLLNIPLEIKIGQFEIAKPFCFGSMMN